jgi:hypothetical protein
MHPTRWKQLPALAAGVVLLATAAGAEKAPLASRFALTPKSFPELHALIRPQKGEYKWDVVPWYSSIWHARRAAAAQDKPIFVFGTGGAGFNDPLGNC